MKIQVQTGATSYAEIQIEDAELAEQLSPYWVLPRLTEPRLTRVHGVQVNAS